MYEVPPEFARQELIEHPRYPEVEKLKLKWCVVPTVTGFTLDLGGIKYSAMPFNGWFMNTEIGRDLVDRYRMDKGLEIAEAMQLDTSSETTMWRDQMWLLLNEAVSVATVTRARLLCYSTYDRAILSYSYIPYTDALQHMLLHCTHAIL
jgi:nitric oxide synthase oxygenase domain/subunit